MLSITELWNQFGTPSFEGKDQSQLNELGKSLEACIKSSDFAPFYALLKEHLQIDNIHESVKEYIAASSTKAELAGPTRFKSCSAYLNFIQLKDLFPNSYDQFFPAFYINSNLWLVIPTGQLLHLHHDATFYETGTEVLGYTDTFESFIQEFSNYGSSMNLNQRFYFETCLSEKGLDNFRRIDVNQQKEVIELYFEILKKDAAEIDVDELDEDISIACMEYLESIGLY